jgi:hypothetical protein
MTVQFKELIHVTAITYSAHYRPSEALPGRPGAALMGSKWCARGLTRLLASQGVSGEMPQACRSAAT